MSLSQIASIAGFAGLAVAALWFLGWSIIGACADYGRQAFLEGRALDPAWDRWTRRGYLRAKRLREETEAQMRRRFLIP